MCLRRRACGPFVRFRPRAFCTVSRGIWVKDVYRWCFARFGCWGQRCVGTKEAASRLPGGYHHANQLIAHQLFTSYSESSSCRWKGRNPQIPRFGGSRTASAQRVWVLFSSQRPSLGPTVSEDVRKLPEQGGHVRVGKLSRCPMARRNPSLEWFMGLA